MSERQPPSVPAPGGESDPLVVRAARQFKDQLLRQEAAQMLEMANAWLAVEQALDAQIAALTLEFAERAREGKTISEAALFRLERYKSLREQAQEQFFLYGDYADVRITQEQALLSAQGLNDSAQLIGLSYQQAGQIGVFFDRLPVEAVQNLVGIAGDGKPVGDLLHRRLSFDPRIDRSAADVWARLVDSLVQGTAQGMNPRKVAANMQNDLAGGLNKALQIARSEQIRVYRMAGAEQYRASGVVVGQKRLTAHDERVCGACIADEGTVYPVTVELPDHSQGRCTPVPVVKGVPETTWLSGEAWFKQQDQATQNTILGPGRAAAWRDGGFAFGQLVTRTRDPIWGAGLVPTTLENLVN